MINVGHIFEVGLIVDQVDALGALDGREVRPLAVHALAVLPSNESVQIPDRSSAVQTLGGTVVTRAGRGLERTSLRGTFGVEVRGQGSSLGTGPYRADRFEREVVLLGSAATQEDITRALVPGSPTAALISAALTGFDPARVRLYLNYYNLRRGTAHAVRILNYATDFTFGRGAASGQTHYQLSIEHLGPAVVSDTGLAALEGLLAGLTAWDAVNDIIEAADLGAITAAAGATVAPFAGEVEDSVAAVSAKLKTAQGLMGGDQPRQQAEGANVDTATFIADATTAARQARQAEEALADTQQAGGFRALARLDWSDPDATDMRDPQISRWSEQIELLELADALDFQGVAGKLFGMGREDYQRFIEAGGQVGALPPVVRTTRPYVVGEAATSAQIERDNGVAFGTLLALNNLRPSEALIPGTTLRVPVLRTVGPQTIDGLPVFDSHTGMRALGADLGFEGVTTTGDLSVVAGATCLEQGLAWLVDEASAIIDSLRDVPENQRVGYTAARVAALVASEPRVDRVQELSVTIDDTGVAVEVAALAITRARVEAIRQ